jgi:hypothetical protein
MSDEARKLDDSDGRRYLLLARGEHLERQDALVLLVPGDDLSAATSTSERSISDDQKVAELTTCHSFLRHTDGNLIKQGDNRDRTSTARAKQ